MDRSEIAGAMARHAGRVGFEFSGGRDSTAALEVMREWWPALRVYWLDTGDTWPETRAVVRAMERRVGRPFVHIRSDVRSYRLAAGWPSDVVPQSATWLGRSINGGDLRVVSRMECCLSNIMRPMHDRLLADGNTLIVRGQRDEDFAHPPTRSGFSDGSVELLFPIQSWSTLQVDDYLWRRNLPCAPYYEDGMRHGSDCLHCTAWWDDGRLPVLRKRHPKAFDVVAERLSAITKAVAAELNTLHEELTHGQ